MPGALLVADQDVPHLLGVEQRVVRRQDRPAGDAEDGVDAERLERPDERAGAGHRYIGDPLDGAGAPARARLPACAAAAVAAAAEGGRWARSSGVGLLMAVRT